HLFVQLGEACLCEREQPRAVPFAGTTVLVASAPQKRSIDRVQFRSASQRVQPDVLVALAFVDRPHTKPPFQEESKRTLGGLFELGHRVDVGGGTWIEPWTRDGHVAVELGELGCVASL